MKQHKSVPRHLVKYQEKEILERLTKRLKMAKFSVIEGGNRDRTAEKKED